MRRLLAGAALAAGLAAGLAAAPAAQAAWMWTGWEDTQMAQEACLQAAAGKLREIGFTVTVNPQTTFGWRGQDGVSVRCIAERRLAAIFVYVTGSQEEGGQLLEQLRTAYRGTAAPAAPRGGGGKF